VLKRGVVSRERIAGVLVAYAFDLCKDDLRSQIFLSQEILRHNRNLKSAEFVD
jgi:hypothetical protein